VTVLLKFMKTILMKSCMKIATKLALGSERNEIIICMYRIAMTKNCNPSVNAQCPCLDGTHIKIFSVSIFIEEILKLTLMLIKKICHEVVAVLVVRTGSAILEH
jgi:hypothetical protein